MNRITFLFLCFFLAALFAGCDLFESTGDDGNQNEIFERRELPRALSIDETQIISGTGAFGFNLMNKLLERDPDVSHFISPLSILMAYGMTMNGADGNTYNQMQKVFGLEGMSRAEINQAARELIDLLTGFDDKVSFNIANSIWHREGYPVTDEFLETNQTSFDAVIEAVDFSDPETLDRINGWVYDKTEGLIEKISDNLDPKTVMYLLNAIYFKGDWTVQFNPGDTRNMPFYLADGSATDVDMMRLKQNEEMFYSHGDDYRAVQLYYGDAGFAMTLILPRENISPQNWLADLSWSKWQEIQNSFHPVTLTLDMPKFELEYEVDPFEEVLNEMGITDGFDPYLADFSRITGGPNGLYIGESKHKTFISVDEKGTEAAAVTSVVLVESAPQTVEISYNRPFFYVISEVESGSVLFMGTYTGVEK